MKTELLAALAAASVLAAAAMDMGGDWRVTGEGLDGIARLPGTLADAGLGTPQSYATWNAISNKQERYALRLRNMFIGKATWSRRVTVPAELAGKPLELFLERVMWESTLKVDGRVVGSRDSLGTPHVYSFAPDELAPGEHLFELVIDNSCHFDFSGWAHAWGPTTQTRWNGVIGRFELREANPLRAARVFAPWPAHGKVEVEVPAEANVANAWVGDLMYRGCERKGNRVIIRFDGVPVAWSEAHPRLYTLRLDDGRGFVHSVRFGFRTLERRGNRIFLNDKPLWVRGDVDNCQFPLTGYPAMTKAEWRRQIRIQQLNGCNAMRSHTWTPPAAAYEAADELGFLWMVEVGYWSDGWMETRALGHGNEALDNYIHAELRRIQDAYGNHPSVMSLSLGNELGACDFGLMDRWMTEAKAYDNRYLTLASTARKVCPSDDYMTTHHYPGIGSVRCWRRPHTDWDYEEAYAKAPIPVIAHEIGQWPVYPFWDDLSHFTGLLKPYDWRWMRSLAEQNGTVRFTRRWHAASLKSNRLMYKDEVESFMRTPSCAGLQLLDVRDYTGQGEALIGWLDANFEAKPGLSELAPFSSVFRPVPFLARFPKYTWTVGERFVARLQVRNLTEETLPAGLRWPWSFAGKGGYLALEADLPPYEIADVGTVGERLEPWMCTAKQTLRFGENSWDVWVFPEEKPAAVPFGVKVTDRPEELFAALADGGRVLYTGGSSVTGKGKFEPVYWSSIHFPSKDPSVAIGTWYDEDHPALAGFPTENWMDWQWRSLAEGAKVHVLRGMPKDFDGIAMPVSDIHFSELLATMFELRVGKGRVFVCGYDLDADTPEARALRRSVFNYVGGTGFAPKTELTMDALKRLVLPDPKAVRQLKASDYRVESDPKGLRLTVKDATPVQGRFKVRFFSEAPVEGTFEGRPCRVEMAVDGEMSLVAPMNREDALDGRFQFECHVKEGSMPRFAGVEIIPE